TGGFTAVTAVPGWFGGTLTQYNGLLTTFNTNASQWAIAHQTTERNGNPEGSKRQYPQIAPDGGVPTLNNVAAGKHDFWVESWGEYQSSAVSANQKLVIDALFAAAKTSSQIGRANQLNAGATHAWGQGGIFAIKQFSACDPTTFSFFTNPCSSLTR